MFVLFGFSKIEVAWKLFVLLQHVPSISSLREAQDRQDRQVGDGSFNLH